MSDESPRIIEVERGRERNLVVITGLSGAGKSNALHAFEDAGYFCIDNLPPRMVPTVLADSDAEHGPEGIVVVMDIRGRRYFGSELEESLESLGVESGWDRKVIFIDSDDPTLVRRYKESRRPHPNAKDGDVLGAIRSERQDLAGLRERADLVVDTSGYTAADARLRFKKLAESLTSKLTFSIFSFGFKHGAPLDADMVLDTRFLANPHYDPELRPLTGHDERVKNAVLGQPDGKEFVEKTCELLTFLLPRYATEGKTYFTLGIGCTGGRHRSVAITEELARCLRDSAPDVELFIRHRDLDRH